MDAIPGKPAIIVVNSLVARGAVGGRAGLFVLERMGFSVWFVPTVGLPWHPGHGPVTRVVPDPAGFAAVLADLAGSPRLGEVGAVLAGYLGHAGQAEPVGRLVDAVRAASPAAIFLCDPVIGDHDGLFQPEAVAEAIRNHLVPRADMAAPNRYELGWLAGASPADNTALATAARGLGLRETIVTSAFAPAGEIGNLAVTETEAVLVAHPVLPDAPHGTGDLLTALYLGHRLDGLSPAEALERAASTTLRLIGIARETGADELPLTAGQRLIDEPAEGMRVATVVGGGR